MNSAVLDPGRRASIAKAQFDRTKRLAHTIITVSHFSKAEIVRAMGVAADRIDVVHEAADPMFRRLQAPACPRASATSSVSTFVLYASVPSGAQENLGDARRCVPADLRLQRTVCGRRLAIAGGSGWKNSAVHEAVDRHGLRDRVHFLGFVSDQELLELYNTCALFCYPSVYEGFGLPGIEAMSCGAPVITGRVSSLPEVGGEAVPTSAIRDRLALSRVMLEEVL
jgi:glycosyltransferase involved in cell wall biosynthesis